MPFCPCHRCFRHPWILPIQVRPTRPQGDLDCPQGVLPPTGLRLFQDHAPFGSPLGSTRDAYSKPVLFNPGGVIAQTLSQHTCFLGAWSPATAAPGALPQKPPLPCPGHPCSPTILVPTLVQKRPTLWIPLERKCTPHGTPFQFRYVTCRFVNIGNLHYDMSPRLCLSTPHASPRYLKLADQCDAQLHALLTSALDSGQLQTPAALSPVPSGWGAGWTGLHAVPAPSGIEPRWSRPSRNKY